MKSLKESLFDSKTQTMESLFDKDLVQKDLSEHEMAIAIIKTYLLQIKNISHGLDYNIVDNSCTGYKYKYPDIIINFNKSQIPIEIHTWAGSIKNKLLKNKSFKIPVHFVGNDSESIFIDFWRPLKESLKESLFDSKTQTMESLFDKDLEKKAPTIRDVYELDQTGIGLGMMLRGVPIDHFFDVKKLLKYPNPYTLSKSNTAMFTSTLHLLGIIVDQPAPIKSTIKTSDHIWCEVLKRILTKYIKRSWRYEWDKKINIYLIEYPNDRFGVSIDFDNGDGSFEFKFRPKES